MCEALLQHSRFERQVSAVPVGIDKIYREGLCTIGRFPQEPGIFHGIADTSPDNCGTDSEACKDLRHLCDMSELVRQIADFRGFAELSGQLHAQPEITDNGFARNQEFVGLHVPWSDNYSALLD